MKPSLSTFIAALIISIMVVSCNKKEEKILVFSKTNGFRHGSIETGVKAIKKLGKENNFKVSKNTMQRLLHKCHFKYTN